VIPADTAWHFTTGLDALDHWQTVVAGFLALLAAFGTVVATMIITRRQIDASGRMANKQIAASREDADRMIAATRAQTEVTAKQAETTVRLEQMRNASEALAFHAMLAAAMTRVIAEAAWARETHPRILKQVNSESVEAFAIRRCITKGAFAELRAACVRQGGPLTGDFLDLEREIDSFASQFRDYETVNSRLTIQKGFHAGLGDQLALIETKAAVLREKAVEAFE
jgi:hypothetical protein